VFAGEDVECTITFKNVARKAGERSPSPSSHYSNGTPPADRQRKVTPTHTSRPPPVTRSSSYGLGIPAHLKKGHRPAHSAGTVSRQSSVTIQEEGGAVENSAQEQVRQKHGRSLSIISMGADGAAGGGEQARNVSEGAWKAARAHGRTSSLQIVPRRGSKGSASPFIGMLSRRLFSRSGLLTPN
jgi:RAB6A-GEF complex partner protein 2